MSTFPRLSAVRGALAAPTFSLQHSPFRLGRDPAQNDIVLPSDDPRISRQHLELLEEFGRWVLVDHSRNGVYVNDDFIHNSRQVLTHNDRIRIGDSVELRFDDPNSTFGQASLTASDLQAAFAQAAPLLAARQQLFIDLNTFTVARAGVVLEANWSTQEFALLRYLHEHRRQVCRYAELLEAVWGATAVNYGREHIHELVARVRRKLEPDPANPIYLITKAGHGYALM